MSEQKVQEPTKVIGYKVTNPDWTCHGFQYKLGETYHMEGPIKCCSRGFHFCKILAECFSYYDFDPENKVAIIEASGQIVTDGKKYCTNTIKIVKELSWQEVLEIINTGEKNTGISNTGDRNSGNHNSGDNNAGDRNSGDQNAGSQNTGDSNAGDCNSGDLNIGDWNTGDKNSGYYNSGDRNTGDRNTGDKNSGFYNSGSHNSGDKNTGDWSSGNHSSGIFCTEKDPKIMMFNQPSEWTFETWRKSKACRVMDDAPCNDIEWTMSPQMNNEEKCEHPWFEITDGYLKETTVLDRHRQEWWDNLSDRDKQAVMDLPNFDPDIFKECTGIQANIQDKSS